MKHIFKRELAAFLAAAAVLGGILAGATHYLTPQQHDYGSVWGMYEQEQTDSAGLLKGKPAHAVTQGGFRRVHRYSVP